MRRARTNQEYVIKLQGREVVHTIAALRTYSNSLSESDNEDGQHDDVPIVEGVIKRLQAAIDEQTLADDKTN
jgi:hypothetical protein